MSALRLVSAGAAQALVGALASREGIHVAGAFGAVGAMLEKFGSGEDCDVLILTRAQIDALVRDGLVVGETVTDLGTVPTAIAVRAGQPLPDVSGEAGLRAALLAADAIYFPDPAKATAGIHFAKVLDLLGIRPTIEARVRTFPNGASAMRTMAESRGHPIGCTQATEILATQGVHLVAPLPLGFELETTYTAAVNAKAADPLRARAFVNALGGASSRELRATAGFAPPAAR